jgi:hypothetical protein
MNETPIVLLHWLMFQIMLMYLLEIITGSIAQCSDGHHISNETSGEYRPSLTGADCDDGRGRVDANVGAALFDSGVGVAMVSVSLVVEVVVTEIGVGGLIGNGLCVDVDVGVGVVVGEGLADGGDSVPEAER